MSSHTPAQDEVREATNTGLDVMDTPRDSIDADPKVEGQHDGTTETTFAAPPSRATTPVGIRSSPPAIGVDSVPYANARVGSPAVQEGKSDSEAETIVLNGLSPVKARKVIKHEDQSDEEVATDILESDMRDVVAEMGKQEAHSSAEGAGSNLGKRKRSKHSNKEASSYTGNSSGLSSVPTSPITTTQSSRSKAADSDSDMSRSPSPYLSRKHSGDHTEASKRRKSNDVEARDDGDSDCKTDRRRSSATGESRPHKSNRRALSTARPKDSSGQTRSASPPLRLQQRSVSVQHSAGDVYGANHKKKRVPAPLNSTKDRYTTEDQSDDSSASASTYPRGSRVRKLATPATGDSISPAKMPPHKKHRDGIGRTFLARACAAEEVEATKQRLDERPQDIDVADNAGNTPLQIASLQGAADIVTILIAAGCDIHCVNHERESPLLDAVENGHIDVVRLLLDAGVNPRRGNARGEEPFDRINLKNEHAKEIREALIAAKNKAADTGRVVGDHVTHNSIPGRPHVESLSTRETASPRPSPPLHTSSGYSLIGSRRGANNRSVKTSNHLLYMAMDVKSLREAAGKGDLDVVNMILQVKEIGDDAESLWAAAKGGHVMVMQLLLAVGNADPDPEPLEDKQDLRMATPILAAMGKDNMEVITLLLDQPNFNPTRKIDNQTYAEIAKQKNGPRWEEEASIFQAAYDKYLENHERSARNSASPASRREAERDSHRVREKKREPLSPSSRKRKLSNSNMETQQRKKSIGSHNGDGRSEKNRASISNQDLRDGQSQSKRKPGRPRKEDSASTGAVSDRETTPLGPPKPKTTFKRSESDPRAVTSENEANKPRRKLVSREEYRGDKDKPRRSSIATTTSVSSSKDRAVSNDSIRADAVASRTTVPRVVSNPAERESSSDRSSDRARSLKRDESKDRLSAIRGDSPVKRPRSSVTPPRSDSQDSSTRRSLENGIALKRRRLEPGLNPDGRNPVRPLSSPSAVDGGSDSVISHSLKDEETAMVKHSDQSSFAVADNQAPLCTSELEQKLGAEVQAAVPEISHQDEELAKINAADAEATRLRLQEAEDQQKRLAEEAQERLIAEAKEARALREQQAQEEEAQRQRDEIERLERQQREDEEARRRAEEERRRIYNDHMRLQREDMERKKLARDAEIRAERQRASEQREALRLAKLPRLLRWFDGHAVVQTPEFASLFSDMLGLRGQSIRPEVAGPEGKEQWLLNTQVALILGIKDLQLSQCKSFR